MSEDSFHLGVKALIRNKSGKVLLFQVNPAELSVKNPAYWDLAGGRIQRGETVTSALKREVTEETGITEITVGPHLGMMLSNIRIPRRGLADVGLIVSIYECRIKAEPNLELSPEHTRYAWVEPAQAAKFLAFKYPAEFCQMVAQLIGEP